MQLTGAQALIKSLEMQRASRSSSASPAAPSCPSTTRILDSTIRHILVRHEQGAGHMAEGYAHATGRPGVAMVTSRPGRDQHRHAAGRRLHGLDPHRRHHRPGRHHGHRHRRLPGGATSTGITMGITKHNLLVNDVARHPPGGRRGVPHRHHRPPRPGAGRRPQGRRQRHDGVVLAVDARRARPARATSPPDHGRPGARSAGGRADPGRRAPGALRRRRHPQGSRRPRRCSSWPSATGIPVVTTLMARGAFPDSPPAVPGHARHARQLRGGHGDAASRPADRPGQPASTTG